MFKVGELINWFETYADVYITKDCGIGIVVDRYEHDYGFPDGPHISYKVYRAKYGDMVIFEKEQIEKNENFSNRP